MSKSTNNQTNPYAHRAQAYFDKEDFQHILLINEQKSFYDRMKGFKNFLKGIILPLLILWSILTEIAFAGSEFYNMTQSLALAIIFTILIVTTVEALKVYVGIHFIRFFSQGWIKDGRHYFAFLFPSLLLFLVAYGSSVFMSIGAGPVISKNFNRYTAEVPLVNIDSIMQVYDAKVNPLIEKQDAAAKTTWAGKIVKDALKTIAIHGSTIQQIEDQRTEALRIAKEENDQRRLENKDGYVQRGLWLQGFAGIGEALQILLLLLFALFERASYIEKPKTPNGIHMTQFIGQANADQQEFQPAQRAIIKGFLRREQRSEQSPEQSPLPVPQALRTVVQEQPEQLVEQAVSIVPEQFEQAVQEPTNRELRTVIVSAPSEDISKWIHYAKTYYKRSIKKTSKPETRSDNKDRFEEYRDLILKTGRYQCHEGKKEVTFTEIPKNKRSR